MNIELDEVVVQDVSDDALELAAGGAQGGKLHLCTTVWYCGMNTACCSGAVHTLGNLTGYLLTLRGV
jgi:hypothetical protein